jgi:hypothetical protein
MSQREIKRKVEDTSFEKPETEESEAFHRSKIVARTPPKGKTREMEEVLKAIHDMRSEMTRGFEEGNARADNLQKELKKTNLQLRQIQEEMTRKEEQWAKEKLELMDRMKTMEVKLEKQEKEKRRNNIIIKNTGIEGTDIRGKVEKFINEKLNTQITTTITEAYEIRKGIILAKILNWQQKQAIMEGKKNLKGTSIYVENDMTKQEREIQRILRGMAKVEREKGNEAIIKYQKMVINGKVFSWEELGIQPAETKNY